MNNRVLKTKKTGNVQMLAVQVEKAVCGDSCMLDDWHSVKTIQFIFGALE